MTTAPAVVAQSTRSAATAELIWRDGAGSLDATVGIPLLLGPRPVFAFTYADRDLAHTVAAAEQVAVAYSDRRVCAPGWRPLVALGRAELTADPTGEIFTDQLLEQELRKYPPSRAWADSAMLRREHWWYLPRLLVTIAVETVEPLRARPGGPDSVLLARLADDTIEAESLTAADLDRCSVEADSDESAGQPALAIGHDFTPDLEQQLRWTTRGRRVEDRFLIQQRTGRPAAATALTLWQRLIRHRNLSRGCRRNLPG